MWLLIRTMLVMCAMAFAAGSELRTEARTVRVPVARVATFACEYDGGAVAATEHPTEPGVYAVTCRDGLVLAAPNR